MLCYWIKDMLKKNEIAGLGKNREYDNSTSTISFPPQSQISHLTRTSV